MTDNSLGDRMKQYEIDAQLVSAVMPFDNFIIRADGKNFSTYTLGLEKPFDIRFARAMMRTANGLLEFFHAMTVFVCSDEISLIFPAIITKDEYSKLVVSGEKLVVSGEKLVVSGEGEGEGEKKLNLPTHIYSGRKAKLETLVAAKASVLFNKFMVEEVDLAISTKSFDYNENLIKRVKSMDAIFDARLMIFTPDKEVDMVNNIIWRSCYDCYRNTLSTYGRFYLGKRTLGKNGVEMIDMVKKEHGFDMETDIPIFYRFGMFGKKKLIEMTNNDGIKYVRGHTINVAVKLTDISRDEGLRFFKSKYFDDTFTEFVSVNL